MVKKWEDIGCPQIVRLRLHIPGFSRPPLHLIGNLDISVQLIGVQGSAKPPYTCLMCSFLLATLRSWKQSTNVPKVFSNQLPSQPKCRGGDIETRKKFEAAKTIRRSAKVVKPRQPPKPRSASSSTPNETPAPTPIPPSPPTPPPTTSSSDHEEEIAILKQQLKEKDERIKELEKKVYEKSRTIDQLRLEAFEKTLFTYENISAEPEKVEYLTGLSVEQFCLILDCCRPYIQTGLKYDENRSATERTFFYETQYLIVMICRHGLDFKFAAYMANVSAVTIGRIFNGWVIFLSTLFNELDQRPHQKFLQEKMPQIFSSMPLNSDFRLLLILISAVLCFPTTRIPPLEKHW